MGNRFLPLALCLVLALSICCSKDRGATDLGPRAIAWSGSLEEARLEAQRTGDRVLASFEAYWCPWSRLLRESLYADPAVVDSLSGYRCVAVDADRDSAICKEYDVKIYPTIIVMDSYGAELNRLVGYSPPREFLDRLASLRRGDRVVAEMFALEAQHATDPQFLLRLGDLLRDMGTYDAALLRYERAAEADAGNKAGIREEATYSMAECCMVAGEYRAAAERFKHFAAADSSSERCEEAMVLAALCYEQAGERRQAEDQIADYLRAFPDGVYAEFARKRIAGPRARSAPR
ncbi:MAG: thioredoxin fold domain-containing protein [bacterium]